MNMAVMLRISSVVCAMALVAVVSGEAAGAARAQAVERDQPRTTTRSKRPPNRYVQVGFASYYGPGFNGDETASGAVFDQRKLVAAHRTLPLGSLVRVTNLENGRQVVLRVIDRGPYGHNHRKGCIIDVSKAAARRLGFVRDGVSRVRVEALRLGARP
jgi:rare lipoprotein A